ncbi:hypothetical protein PG994_007693 [Apiospora phragmitis]|uniref:Alkyl hydroperoxide reductase subunit C/ Thiol specific antioxidant domain-containing protein n=1 Tax=Apiospora phragmitis TaxID=2905665 RepID=A0ABR1URM7_9PEZI
MFSSLTTKLAMRKAGIRSNTFDFSSPEPKRGAKGAPEVDESANGGWPQWMTVKKLPLTAQAWLSPLPPPVPIAPKCPKVGDLAPLDRDRQLQFGGGKRIVVLFLRCSRRNPSLALRTLANRHQGKITCIAVSHSSHDATRKWMDLLGGAWNVEVLIDEDRAIYAAWGLGLGSVWVEGEGWLGEKVAGSINRTGSMGPGAANKSNGNNTKGAAAAGAADEEDEGPSTALGNKWQQAGVFSIDGRGTVVYAEKATRADDVMNLDAAVQVLGL